MRDQLDIGPSIPRWRNRALYLLGWCVLRLSGWKVRVRLPDAPRYMVILAPHTSNWDFVFGMAAVLLIQVRVNFIGKHTLFRGPQGWLFRALGGRPVDRSAPGGIVQQSIEAFRGQARMIIALAPEGTRARREQWKRGFYHIATGARVPIAVAYLDYARREIGIGPIFMPTGDWNADMQPVFDFYRGITAKKPENFAVDAR